VQAHHLAMNLLAQIVTCQDAIAKFKPTLITPWLPWKTISLLSNSGLSSRTFTIIQAPVFSDSLQQIADIEAG
jgi:hypothetical protein